jgi:hypothetical protein
VLALLALAGLIRCCADPAPLQYNFVDVIIPLAAWEIVGKCRLPVVTVLTWVPAALLLPLSAFTRMDSAYVNAVSIAWTLVLGVYLARSALWPLRASAPGASTPAASTPAASAPAVTVPRRDLASGLMLPGRTG